MPVTGRELCSLCAAPSVTFFEDDPSRNPEDERPATGPIPPGTPDEIQPPAEPVTPNVWVSHSSQFGMKPPDLRRYQVRAALIAGVLGGLGFLIPIAPIIFVLMLAAGGIAVTIYMPRVHGRISTGEGFKLGILTGFFGTVIWSVLTGLTLLSPNMRSAARLEWERRLQEALAQAPDPATRQWVERLGSAFSGTGGLIAVFAIGMLVSGLFYLVIAGIGGAVGATIFGRRPSERA